MENWNTGTLERAENSELFDDHNDIRHDPDQDVVRIRMHFDFFFRSRYNQQPTSFRQTAGRGVEVRRSVGGPRRGAHTPSEIQKIFLISLDIY